MRKRCAHQSPELAPQLRSLRAAVSKLGLLLQCAAPFGDQLGSLLETSLIAASATCQVQFCTKVCCAAFCITLSDSGSRHPCSAKHCMLTWPTPQRGQRTRTRPVSAGGTTSGCNSSRSRVRAHWITSRCHPSTTARATTSRPSCRAWTPPSLRAPPGGCCLQWRGALQCSFLLSVILICLRLTSTSYQLLATTLGC